MTFCVIEARGLSPFCHPPLFASHPSTLGEGTTSSKFKGPSKALCFFFFCLILNLMVDLLTVLDTSPY